MTDINDPKYRKLINLAVGQLKGQSAELQELLLNDQLSANNHYALQAFNDAAFGHLADLALDAGNVWAQPPVIVPPDPDPVPPPSGPVLEYVLAAPFQASGKYAHLGYPTAAQRTNGTIMREARAMWINSNNSSKPETIPAYLSDRNYIGNSELADGDRGPLWGAMRGYNVHGFVDNTTVMRSGDFHKGREGHAFYANVLGDTIFENCHAVECGGQAFQMVWRESETAMTNTDQQRSESQLTLTDCSAIDCGQINEGASVRASWPFAIYNPGQSVFMYSPVIHTFLPTFSYSGGAARSHGGIFIGMGQVQRRTPFALIDEPDIDCVNSDREKIRLWGIDSARINGATCKGVGVDVVIVDDCTTVKIYKPKTDLRVEIKSADRPYGASIKSLVVRAGQEWSL